ncbi:MAG TPA: DUF433 domain-containing protein [Gemmataceae bacterium]
MSEKRRAETVPIWLDAEGRAWVDDTTIKVIEVVLDTMGVEPMAPEQIHEQYPHLSMAQIHAALSYYHLHKEDFDEKIRRGDEEYRRAWEASRNDPLVRRLREIKEKRQASV